MGYARRVTSLATVTPVVVADSIRYTDFQVAANYPTSQVRLWPWTAAHDPVLSVRRSADIARVGKREHDDVVVVVDAIVGSAGSYPVDLTQGYPGGRFVTVALRIASRNTRLPNALPKC